jgi:hypothetical protein
MKRVLAALALFGLAPFGLAPCIGAQELKDPTRPPVAAAQARREAPAPRPRVTAIFVSAQRRVATFDDQPVHEGDRVGACLIEEITTAGVRYRTQGHSLFAALAPVAP